MNDVRTPAGSPQGINEHAGSACDLAILWSRIGPYHLARYRGAVEVFSAASKSVLCVAIAPRDGTYEWQPLDPGEEGSVVTVFPGRRYDGLTRGEIASAVRRTLDLLRPCAVAINGWAAVEARAASGWCRQTGARAIVMSETKRDDSRRWWLLEVLKRRIVGRFDAALVGGRAQAEYLVSLGFPADRIHLGYDVVDNDHFARKPMSSVSGTPLPGEAAERLYFFACTRFLRRKNLDGLLHAYAKYRDRCGGSPWDLVIAGSGALAGELRRLTAALRLSGVHWPGFVQYRELPAYYARAGAFVHPAKAEAWGLVVNEAAASGLPLLVSDRVGARYELVREGDNGILFDPWNVDDICSALLRISAMDTAARQRMGHRSREIVGAWTPRRFGEGLLAAARGETVRSPS